jgi:hypothetical protein
MNKTFKIQIYFPWRHLILVALVVLVLSCSAITSDVIPNENLAGAASFRSGDSASSGG